jgi:hypothetical protein
MNKLILALIAITGLGTSLSAFSQATRSQVYGGALTRQSHTFYIQSDVGMQTYESAAVDSNATSTVQSYKVGGYFGEARRLGLAIGSSEAVTPFELNDTRIRSGFRDLELQVRLGFLNPFVVASDNEINIKTNGEDYLHVHGQGMGVGANIQVPMTAEIITTVSAKVVNTTKAYDRLGHDVTIGNRTEIDANAAVDVTEHMVDAYVGYRRRSYTLKVDGVEASELQSIPYAGLRFGVYF